MGFILDAVKLRSLNGIASIDHYSAWLAVQRQAEFGIISAAEARRLEGEVYESMWGLGLTPDDVTGPFLDVPLSVGGDR